MNRIYRNKKEMVLLKYLLFILFFLFHVEYCIAIEISAIAYMFDTYSNLFSSQVDEFNEYAQKNSLNITIKLNLITPNDGSYDYSSHLDVLFSKRSDKYDLIFNTARVMNIHAQHYEDLKKYLSGNYTTQYQPEVYSSCINKGKLIGLPASVDINVLYANIKILNKYEKRVPKTWKELLETTKFILKEEKRLYNNTDFSGYNGLFCDTEEGTSSVYEFIYSYRDTVKSPIPKFTSQNAVEALKMIKKLKEEISSDLEFKSAQDYMLKQLFDSKSLFLKHWYMPIQPPDYQLFPLPGRIEGISAGITGGSNICINKYINEERKVAAAKFIEFVTSYEMQKKVLLNKQNYSPRVDLYNDRDVCEELDCDFFKAIQPISRPYNKVKDYTSFTVLFRKYAYEFIYGDKTAEEVLTKIDDIDRIYYYTISTEKSFVGLILFIIHIVIGVIILLSVAFLYIDKYKVYFQFFSHDFWYIIIMGIMLQIATSLLELGPLNIVKCHLKVITISLGYSFLLIPTLHKLITNYPEENRKIIWISKHKYIFFLSFFSIDLLINGLSLITPYTLKTVVDTNRKNYQTCKMNSNFGLSMIILTVVYKIINIIAIGFFSFIEWNIKETKYDVHFIVASLYFDGLCFLALIVVHYIGFKDYMYLDAFHQLIYLAFILSNYILYYGIKILTSFYIKEDEESNLILSLIHKFQTTHGTYTTNDNGQCISVMSDKIHNSKSTSLENRYSKIIKYHYQTSKSESIVNIDGKRSSGTYDNNTISRTEDKDNVRTINSTFRE